MIFVRHFEQSHPRKRKYLMFKMYHECNEGSSAYHCCAKSELRFCAGSNSARHPSRFMQWSMLPETVHA